ncbi:MAG: hypothetical protein COA43_03400 [Robiginitomaculum sp.]|nr:MAG: hypothetical protein COA43_03400 [Robiginitomaculum sp.]
MRITKLISVAAACVATSIVLSTTALAQTTILVVDQNRVLRESSVGKHIDRQLTSIAKQMDSEIKSQAKPLTGERERLMNELKNMSVDALKSRPDLQKRAQTLQGKMQKTQVEGQYKQKELEVTRQKAMNKVHEKLTTILKNLVKERNADIVLDRSVVIFSGDSVDITATVISRLNSQMRTVSVVRERIPRKQRNAK